MSRSSSPGSSPLPIMWKNSTDPDKYEEARVSRIFNRRRPDRSPIAIIHASEEAHIVEAVRIAIKEKTRISIRAGGHAWAVWSLRDDSILLDLVNHKEIDLDEKTGIVKISPSTTGAMLNEYLGPKGYMFMAGHCPDVGLAGFLLQGGFGWNTKNFGWACENVVGIDVVTAQAEVIHCDSQENSDLFWAARGAGPGFPGIVSRFYLKVRPLQKAMTLSSYIFSKSDYRTVMDWVIKIAPVFDKDTEIVAVANYPPGESDICINVLFITFKMTREEAIKVLRQAEDSCPASPISKDLFKPTSLANEYFEGNNTNETGQRMTVDSAFIRNDADVPKTLEKAFLTLPSKEAFSIWFALNPASRRQRPDMAVSLITDHYLTLYTIWTEAADDQRCISWVQDIMKGVGPDSIGAYVGDADFQIRNTKFWGESQGKRLMEIRRRWDPNGVICGYLDRGDVSRAHGLPNIQSHEKREEKL